MPIPINLIFWGTPDVASDTLEILKEAGLLPSLIVTSPDAKSGRGLKISSSPAAQFAEENGIPCLKPEKLDGEFYNKLRPICLEPNSLFLVVAYGKIMPEELIKLPRLGSLNIHYSLLPKYRGASPVESAVLSGDAKTGVAIQQMEYKLDTGPLLALEEVNILPAETAPELRKRLIKIGGDLLAKILPDFIAGKIKPVTQDESKATYSKKIKKEDGLIDLSDDPVKNYNKYRAYANWPRTFFFEPARNASGIADAGGSGKRVIITKARLEEGNFIIEKVIPEGGKEKVYNPL